MEFQAPQGVAPTPLITKYRGTIYSITIYTISNYFIVIFVLLALPSSLSVSSHRGICHRHGVVVVFIMLASLSLLSRCHLAIVFVLPSPSPWHLPWAWRLCHLCHAGIVAVATVVATAGIVIVVQALVALLCWRGCFSIIIVATSPMLVVVKWSWLHHRRCCWVSQCAYVWVQGY